MFALFTEKTFFHLWWYILVSFTRILPKAFPVILLTELYLYEYPGFFCSGFVTFKTYFFLEINLVWFWVSLLLIPVLFEAPFYTIIRLKLKYLLFSYGTDTIKAGFSTIYGRFLKWFDSEAAVWVSGVAETVEYFG